MRPGTPNAFTTRAAWADAVEKALSSKFRNSFEVQSADPKWRQRIPANLKQDQYIVAWRANVLKKCLENEDERYQQPRGVTSRFVPTDPQLAISCVLGLPIHPPSAQFPPVTEPDITSSDDDTSSENDNEPFPNVLDRIEHLIELYGGSWTPGWNMLKDCLSMLRRQEAALSAHSSELQRASYAREQDLEERHHLLNKREAKLGHEQRKVADQLAAVERRESALSSGQMELERQRNDLEATVEAEMLTSRLELNSREEQVNRREAEVGRREEALQSAEHQQQDLSSREADLGVREARLRDDISSFETDVSQRNAGLERRFSDLQARETQATTIIESSSSRSAELDQREATLRQQQDQLRVDQATINVLKQDAAAARAMESARSRRLLREAYEADVRKLNVERQALDERRKQSRAKEAELKGLSDRLHARGLELDQRQDHLTQDGERLQRDRRDLEDDKKALKDRTDVLSGREMRQEEKEREHRQKEVDLAQTNRALAERKATIKQRETELSETAASLSQREDAVKAREEAASSCEDALSTRDLELEERAKTLEERDGHLKESIAGYNSRMSDFEVAQFDHSVHVKELAERNAQLEVVRAAVDEREERLSKREQELVEMHSYVTSLQVDLEERRRMLTGEEQRFTTLQSQHTSDADAEHQRNRALLEANYREAWSRVSEGQRQVRIKEKELQSQREQLQIQQISLQEQEHRQTTAQQELEQREARLLEREKLVIVREATSYPSREKGEVRFEVRAPPRPWLSINPFFDPVVRSHSAPFTGEARGEANASIMSPAVAVEAGRLAFTRIPDHGSTESQLVISKSSLVSSNMDENSIADVASSDSGQNTFSRGSKVRIYGGNFFNIGGNLSDSNISSLSDPINRPTKTRVKDDQHIQYRQDIKLTWVENVRKALSSRFRKLPDIVSADPRWKKRIPPNTRKDQRIAAWISAVLKESIEKEDERYRQSREAGVRFLPTSPDILISRVLDSGTESPETSPGHFPYTDSTYSDHGSSHNDDNGALLFNLDQITMACLTALGKLQRATYTRKQEIETRHRLLEKEMRLGEEQQKVARQAVIIDQRLSELAAAEEEVTLAKMQLRAEEQSMECRETIFQKRKDAFAISRQQLLSKQAALDAREAQFHSEMAAFEDSVSRHNADMQHQSSDLQTREAQVALSLRSVSEREARVEEREAVLALEQEELRARQGAVATVNCKESDHINTTEGEGPGYQSAVRNEEADQGASYKHQQLEGKGADCSPQLRLLQLVFRDKEGYQELLKQKGVVAQSLLDLLQKIVTGLSPFHEHRTDGAVILAVMRGERPSRPLDIISDDVWFLMNKCWAIDPSARPTAEELLTALPVGRCITPAEDWDLTPFSELSRNIGGCVQHRDALEFLEAVVEKQGMDNPVVNTHADGILDVV
ncbi:hypothetical protein VNI00_011133 [Paramarasmius palmivorus]|uniref:Protein kinase domain-containing protein n=1 Tax=Paramarasmius palmivorus TaxID=297713 RepID=A0AAW0CEA9_9AGAR